MSGSVYFIKPVDFQGPIRVGFSWRFEKRFGVAQCESPFELEVLAAVPGSLDDENRLHRIFSDFHVRGSWYSPSRPILDLIAQLNAGKSISSLVAGVDGKPSARTQATLRGWETRRALSALTTGVAR